MFNNRVLTHKILGICKSANEDGASFVDIIGALHTTKLLNEYWYLNEENLFHEKQQKKVKKYVIKNRKKINK